MISPLKWALYARKSNESEDRQIQSIPDQVNYLRELASREHLHIAETISEAKSAKAPEVRDGFKQLITLIEQGKIQGILAWKLDRLSRNPPDSARIQWLLQTGKIQCIKTSDRNYLPDENALLFAVEQGMANQYIRELSKNVKRGLHAKVEKGWYPCVPPVGYVNTKWGKKGLEEIVVDAERFALVRKMWDLMLSGVYTPMEILRIATKEWKLDTPKRRLNGKKPIVPSYIYRIFTNIFYTGYFYYGGTLYEGKHQPMITMAEFDKVQILLGRKSQPRPIVHDFSYTGIMKCAECGASITASERKKLVKSTGELKTYTYYHCTRRVGIDDCHAPPVTLKSLEEQIQSYIRKFTVGDTFLTLALEVLAANKGHQKDKLTAIQAKQHDYILELQKKMDRLLTYLLNETITEEDYGKQKQELEKRLAIEKGKIAQVNSEEANTKEIENALHFCHSALQALQNGGTRTRRKVLQLIGSNQKLNQKKLCIDVFGWLLAIKKGEETLLEEIDRFGLEKDNNGNVETIIQQFYPLMCGVVDNVRTELSKVPNPNVANLSAWVNDNQSPQAISRNTGARSP